MGNSNTNISGKKNKNNEKNNNDTSDLSGKQKYRIQQY